MTLKYIKKIQGAAYKNGDLSATLNITDVLISLVDAYNSFGSEKLLPD